MSVIRFMTIEFHYPCPTLREIYELMAHHEWALDFEGKIEYALSADADMDFDWKTVPASKSGDVLDQLDEAFRQENKVAVRQHHVPTGVLCIVHYGVRKNALWIDVYGEVPLLYPKHRIADVSKILRLFEPLITRSDIYTCEWTETH